MSEVFSSRMLEQDGEKTPELGASAVVFFRLLFASILPYVAFHLPSFFELPFLAPLWTETPCF